MVYLRNLVVLALLVSGSAAIDIATLFGFGGSSAPKEAPQAPEQLEQRQLLQQLGQALGPVAANLPNLPSLTNQLRPTVHKSVFIQVTSTQTVYPVCVTAYDNKPPCAALSAPSAQMEHPYEHHEENLGAYDAVHLGGNQGVLGYELHQHPQYALMGHVPKPGYQDFDDHEVEYKNIKPSAAGRMPEATAMLELAREKREVVELDGSVSAEPESEPVRPHPRYLIGPKFHKFHKLPVPVLPLPPVTETKTLYMTKVEKVVDHHVTATMVAHNCVPDHMPFCPSAPKPVYASHAAPFPVYGQPDHRPVPLKPVQWHKDASEKSDVGVDEE